MRLVGHAQALVERPHPIELGHAPQAVASEHFVVVDPEPAACEPRVDLARRAERSRRRWRPPRRRAASRRRARCPGRRTSVNSRRAALPRSSHAHATGAGPFLEIEKSISRAVRASCCRLSTRPMSRDGTPARSSRRNSCGRCAAARTSTLLVGRAEDRVAQRDRAAGVEADQIGHRQDAADALAVEHRHVLDAGREHVDVASTASWPTGTVGDRRARDPGAREPRQPAVAARHPRAHVGVGDDPQLGLSPVARAAPRSRSEPSRSAAARSDVSRLAEDRRTHDRRHRRRAHVQQPVDGVTGSRQARAHRPGDVARARRR